ncbi:hypothetical protein VTN77DRAFT_698 [Rasamsonia byssochlamydoides]|uniref:uncharacterized protein n=1 Tax=Rasamsonia byssochlamydoides TaxID=89139 RepID=UPI0037437A07
MKAIRRSLKGDRDSKPHHHHVSITPKSAIAILPPKKVIKALYDYEPEPGNTQELAFSKGDFFHVISREDDPDWYEACNPLIPSARGLVPVSFFEVIGKTERHSGGSSDGPRQELHDSGFSERSGRERRDSTNTTYQGPRSRMSSVSKGATAMVYGVVQYDFHAERPDELEAKAGEAIIVIAISNPEWFVAKPIGRLGGPGLIPVSFIEIRDMTTGLAVADPLEAVKRAGVPRVEEWKKMTAEYKNSSISLGKLDSTGPGVQSVTNSMQKMSIHSNGGAHGDDHGYNQRTSGKPSGYPHQPVYSQQQQQQQQQAPPPQQNKPQLLAPVSASIPRYCFDNDKYWYIIEAKMEDGSCWELSRYYHDFYDFQIALLTQFEEEAGNKGKPRTLPYMPGPVTHVTDAISNGRRQNLDDYIKKLLAMPPHISRCQLVRELFAPRPGDFEIDPNAVGDPYRLSGESQQSSGHDASRDSRQSSQGHMSTSGAGYAAPAGAAAAGPTNRASHQSHQSHQSHHSHQSYQSHRAQPSLSQNSNASQSRAEQQPPMNRQPSSLTQVSTSSAGAMKVKVHFQDDLIALRVPNDISFQQLQDKLRERLKINEEMVVQYRDEQSSGFVDMLSDNDLDLALQRNSKLILRVSLAG